jgi:hypothetical protein
MLHEVLEKERVLKEGVFVKMKTQRRLIRIHRWGGSERSRKERRKGIKEGAVKCKCAGKKMLFKDKSSKGLLFRNFYNLFCAVNECPVNECPVNHVMMVSTNQGTIFNE